MCVPHKKPCNCFRAVEFKDRFNIYFGDWWITSICDKEVAEAVVTILNSQHDLAKILGKMGEILQAVKRAEDSVNKFNIDKPPRC
jgi:hypothetical protein